MALSVVFFCQGGDPDFRTTTHDARNELIPCPTRTSDWSTPVGEFSSWWELDFFCTHWWNYSTLTSNEVKVSNWWQWILERGALSLARGTPPSAQGQWPTLRYVGVIWYAFHVSQLQPIRFTQRNLCRISKSVMKHVQNLDWKIGPSLI